MEGCATFEVWWEVQKVLILGPVLWTRTRYHTTWQSLHLFKEILPSSAPVPVQAKLGCASHNTNFMSSDCNFCLVCTKYEHAARHDMTTWHDDMTWRHDMTTIGTSVGCLPKLVQAFNAYLIARCFWRLPNWHEHSTLPYLAQALHPYHNSTSVQFLPNWHERLMLT